MMTRTQILSVLFAAVTLSACNAAPPAEATAPPPESAATGKYPAEALAARDADEQVARGKYLVDAGGCHDCHTPWIVGPKGPEPDMTRMLSGHPMDLIMPAAPAPNGPWVTSVAGSMTAWSGPWGTSFTANLTPDDETGLGTWDANTFIATIRTGRHMGRGRNLLPPMPWFNYAKLTDKDLRAIFAYLESIPAVKNRVPEPLPPLTM